jgi:hypothetical protein
MKNIIGNNNGITTTTTTTTTTREWRGAFNKGKESHIKSYMGQIRVPKSN